VTLRSCEISINSYTYLYLLTSPVRQRHWSLFWVILYTVQWTPTRRLLQFVNDCNKGIYLFTSCCDTVPQTNRAQYNEKRRSRVIGGTLPRLHSCPVKLSASNRRHSTMKHQPISLTIFTPPGE